jgi:hypothetical protein
VQGESSAAWVQDDQLVGLMQQGRLEDPSALQGCTAGLLLAKPSCNRSWNLAEQHPGFPVGAGLCRFEGLTRDAVPHGMGVLIVGNGTGGGFHPRDVRRGDK